jgi:hypothetical protein
MDFCFSVATITALFFLMISMILLLTRRAPGTFKEQSFVASYGSLFEGLRLESKMHLMYNSMLLWRRLLFSLSAIFLGRCQMLQIQIFISMSVLNMMYLVYYQPLETLGQNRLELVNELIVLISGYHMLFFTGIQPLLDPGTSEDEP